MRTLDETSDILWLDDITLISENKLLVSPQRFADGIASVGDLAIAVQGEGDASLRTCAAPQILEAPYGVLNAIQESYEFRFDATSIEAVEANDLVRVIDEDGCELVIGFPQHAQFGTSEFVALEDDHDIVSLFGITPVTRLSLFDNFPRLSDILNQFEEPLDSTEIHSLISLNEVGVDGIADSGDEMSMDLLIPGIVEKLSNAPARITENVVRAAAAQGNPAIRLGVEAEPTRHLATQLLRLLLVEHGQKVNVVLTAGDPLVLRTALENDEIDLYIESTETALTTYYNLSADTFPTEPDRTFALIRFVRQTCWHRFGLRRFHCLQIA